MEPVGERPAMLIVRDLAVRPGRDSDAPGVPTGAPSTRLKDARQGSSRQGVEA